MTTSETTTENFVRGSSNPPPVHVPTPDLPAPLAEVGVIGWLHKNLFSGVFHSSLSVAFSLLAIYVVWNLVDWAHCIAELPSKSEANLLKVYS